MRARASWKGSNSLANLLAQLFASKTQGLQLVAGGFRAQFANFAHRSIFSASGILKKASSSRQNSKERARYSRKFPSEIVATREISQVESSPQKMWICNCWYIHASLHPPSGAGLPFSEQKNSPPQSPKLIPAEKHVCQGRRRRIAAGLAFPQLRNQICNLIARLQTKHFYNAHRRKRRVALPKTSHNIPSGVGKPIEPRCISEYVSPSYVSVSVRIPIHLTLHPKPQTYIRTGTRRC